MDVIEPDCSWRCTDFVEMESCPRHRVLTPDEMAVVEVLYAHQELSVGREGSGFCAGQAQELVLTLHRAGVRFRVVP